MLSTPTPARPMSAQLGRGLQQLGVRLHGGANDERVGVGEFGFEAAGAELGDLVGGDDVPAGFLLEHGERGGRDFFCENNLHEHPLAGIASGLR